ncbi:hypothetical protein NVV43_30985, partial [Escherichia marmotae]|nr:hypothetical protein [Escherichia marmotae]
ALAMQPDTMVAWLLANTLRERGDHAACLAGQRMAIELDPKNPATAGNLLYDLHYVADQSPESIAEQHFAWGRRHADPV